mmetsp:Transcript_49219/g.56754  ORF Transcript_49219/g.56754 Transcript_49219/m.56754 type:complete len:144 (-) Transcript_49219:201-632(-)
MLRVLFLLLIVLTMNNIDQTQGFVVAGGCGSIICGKRISSNSNSNSNNSKNSKNSTSFMGTTIITLQNNQHSHDVLSVITTPHQQTSSTTTSTITTSTGTIRTEGLAVSVASSSSSLLTTFDSDLYRQEMLDLVYERNLQRCL